MKIKILTATLFLTSFLISAQTNYYKTTDGVILTQVEVDQQKQKIVDKISKSNPEAVIAIEIKDKNIKGDSIINDYGIHVDLTPNTSRTDKEGLEKYMYSTLPEIPFFDIKGKEYQVADFKGKPTLINFWFASCKPCVDEMPELNKLRQYFGDRVNFIAITFESKEKVEKFLQKQDFDFEHMINAQHYLDALEMQSYPKNVILDKDGLVKSIESGIAYIQGENGDLEMGEATELKNTLTKLLK
ncbi:TlpA disulfide reductase family protein [uncultured Aquimarina sp.]|uniref:TlpA family protein disulfide reductase n=1 Tax=uncultured Aquimarina sp. TaxID=575652 RepID=UPI002608E990|nr:TlpA disulfide reductase family protein [uncultured Aquimarina sp.]